jgi:CheY-like chemotaxis protein
MAGRILIADDSPFWREQLRLMLEEPGWLVFEAGDGSEAVRKAGWVHPDVIILDMSMPVLDGLGAARQIKEDMPGVPILIVTVDKSALLEAVARQAGVLAVYSKIECIELRNFLRRKFHTAAA